MTHRCAFPEHCFYFFQILPLLLARPPQPGPPVSYDGAADVPEPLRYLNCASLIQQELGPGFKLLILTISPVVSTNGKTSEIQEKGSLKSDYIFSQYKDSKLDTVVILSFWICIWRGYILPRTQVGGYYRWFWYLVGKYLFNKSHFMVTRRCEALSWELKTKVRHNLLPSGYSCLFVLEFMNNL